MTRFATRWIAIAAATASIGFSTHAAVARGGETYATDVRDRMQRLERRVRGDVADGKLPPSALDEFGTRARQIDQQLVAAESDGVIDEFERRQLHAAVHSISAVTDPGGTTRWGGMRAFERARWNWEKGFW
jgi:uncharacterized membrane protein YebE (DUF533 family)